MSKRKFSFIWLYFEEKEGKRAKCKVCKAILSFSGGSQSNLKRHLKSKHALTSLGLERHILSKQERAIKLEKTTEENTSKSNQISTETEPNQLTPTLVKNPPAKHIDVEKLDRIVLKMIAKGYHSFRFVEEPDFKNFINELSNYTYNLPSRKNLLYNLLPKIHTQLLEDIKLKMQSATDVCLTIDTWTSTSNAGYISVTAHYINPETVHTSHLIACREFENIHSSENLYNFIKTVITNFNIDNKIIAIVSDHSPNIVSAIHQEEWMEISCFAYSLNLIVQAATAQISDTINKVRKIVEYFRMNFDDLNEMEAAQKLMNLPNVKLKQDDPLRWNSTFDMLHRIKEAQDAVISVLSLKNPNLVLTLEDWEIISEALSILKPFYEVIQEISEEKDVPLSKVTVLCNLLESFIQKCLPCNEKVIAMVRNLQRDFVSCFGNLEKRYLYAESTILDPRFKQKGFKTHASYEQAVTILRNKIGAIKLQNVEEEISEIQLSTITQYNSIWEEYDLEFSKTVVRDNVTHICELDKYLNENYIDRKSDALLWWKTRKNVYPNLYLFVLKRLCIVGTSVPCERLFSSTAQSVSQRRTILEPNEVEGIVFLHNNM